MNSGNRITQKDMILVGIQIMLFAAYLPTIWLIPLPKIVHSLGLMLTGLGLTLLLLALIQLNSKLSPFPTPKSNTNLKTNGAYAVVRHPIYTGIILLCAGYSLHQESLWKLIVSILILILFHFKSNYEESLLIRKFEDYQTYKEKTGKLWPRFVFPGSTKV